MDKKRILIFSTAYLPFIGGAEIAIKEITDRLGSDFEFDLITAKMRKGLPFREKIGNVTVYRLGIGKPLMDKMILLLEGAIFVRHLEKRGKYSAYWCVMVSFASLVAYIKNLFTIKNTPIILTLQEGDSEEHLKYRKGGLISLSWKLMLRSTTYLTAISTYLLNRARAYGFRGEAAVIPNGVNTKIFTENYSEEDLNNLKASLGISNEDRILITTSRLTKKNAVEDIINSLKFLPANYKFLILGVGEDENKLRNLVSSNHLEKRVQFLGLVDHAEIPKYLKISDVFIRPSLSEGMGNSFIEAMAAEVPVVATPVGGIVDFLKDRETGLFCNVNDPQSIADKVLEYENNSELREGVVHKAKEMVIRNYDWVNISEDVTAKVFNSVIN